MKNNDIDMKCTILRRKIRSLEDGSITVVYTADPKLIKKFIKRKKSKGRHSSRGKAQHQSIMSLAQVSKLNGLTNESDSTRNTNLLELASKC